MDRQALVDSIVYCGLVCGMCHSRAACDFCKNTASLCARSEVALKTARVSFEEVAAIPGAARTAL